MAARVSPATVVICAPLGRLATPPAGRPGVPVTWVADLDTIVARGDRLDGGSLALAIEPGWLASRQALRAALVRARHAVPGIEAAVLRDGRLAHHAVFAEEGIRAVVVDDFAAVGRTGRRPAPAGWSCRNVAWGLWEVRTCPPRRMGWSAWLPGLPAPRAGGLYVASAASDAGLLSRLVDWAARGAGHGRAAAIALGDLPAILEGRRPASLAGSVLAAA